ncbi:sigma factor-like helix-turn-helix DNA-binding protein [Streptomyces sp. LN704]|uniref:sigma factor-like helix-turn-helix DNA-binding protein n=1 Tax=unclassified Streptomyces TaxID=2593676 RepID=UPI003716BA78
MLREAFDYPYRQISEILGQSPTGARQLVSRARKHLAAEKRATTTDCHRYLTAFVKASHAGNVAVLEKFFTQEVVSYYDSGRAAKAA